MNADAKIRVELGALGGDLRFDEPLTRYGTYRIGGPATAVFRPDSPEDVARAVRLAGELGIPLIAIGLGSNVLFHDDGFHGLVLRLANNMASITHGGPEDAVWTVGAGAPTPRLARRSASMGYAGVQRLVGVPGAVGGGVFMNAGAHQQDFAAVVKSVVLVTEGGDVVTVVGRDIPWAYRTSGLRGVVVETTLQLEPSDPILLQRELVECLRRRRAGTPFDQPCCGSVFRNPSDADVAHLALPEPRTAGRLIELAGMKGFRIGGAEVSPMHANYIVSVGGATAADVKAVVVAVEQRVQEQFGVTLVREVKFVSTSGLEGGEEQ